MRVIADQHITRVQRPRRVGGQEMPLTDGFVITDDYNPLESMQIGKAEKYREVLLTRVGPSLLLW